ncbi:MAG: twin-arginine translocase subunit TatB [Kordiimonadaceae bacterium]|nr:twin-arginine translocase subunit TatB [Kordiimonadaceae bacterium]
MFDVGFPELFIIAVLAIIFVGPKDLPKVVRSGMTLMRKIREMGREFQDGVKKMADEVELEAVTRKLNEAANIPLEDAGSKKKEDSASNEFADYKEFDYDEYDYDHGGYSPSAKSKKKDTVKDSASNDEAENEQPADKAENPVETASEQASENANENKSKQDV